MTKSAVAALWCPDGLGHGVPLDVAARAREVRDDFSVITSALEKTVKRIKSMRGGALPHNRWQDLKTRADVLFELVKSYTPVALCPYCFGNNKWCSACDGTGTIGQPALDVAEREGLTNGPFSETSSQVEFADEDGYVDEPEPPADYVSSAEAGDSEVLWDHDEEEQSE